MIECCNCNKETSNPKFCSLSCSATSQNRNKIRVKPKTNPCRQCSQQTRNPKFCSKTCSAIYNNLARAKFIYCEYCGIRKQTNRGLGRFCSIQHQQWFRQENLIHTGTATAQTWRNFLIRTIGKCSICGINKYCGKSITLELDHISGDWRDNSKENVRLLCPNCHSQTDTYKSKNRGKGRPLSIRYWR